MSPKKTSEGRPTKKRKHDDEESSYETEESSSSDSEYDSSDTNGKRNRTMSPPKTKKKITVKISVPKKSSANEIQDYPFKNPDFVLVSTSNRKGQWKQLKQLLAQEQRDKDDSTQLHLFGKDAKDSYSTIEAPPSTIPPKKYCDITGFVAKYTDPSSKLRYYGPQEYHYLRQLPESAVQNILSIRKAETLLK